MENYYLIPANSKKSGLIFGLFKPVDLIIFGSGVGITFIFLMALNADTFGSMIAVLLPALIAGFLVFPVPNYHNVLQLFINIYTFYFMRPRKYIWRGWCYKNGE